MTDLLPPAVGQDHTGAKPDGWQEGPLKKKRKRRLGRMLGLSREGIAVHWEAAPPRADHSRCAQQVEEIRNYHLSTGYSDIAYNYLVCNHGQVFTGRGWDIQSAATCNGSYNARFWAVCAMTGPGHDSTPEMRKAIRGVVDEAKRRGATEVICHRDACATACPGDEICGWVKAGLPVDEAPAPPPPKKHRRNDDVIFNVKNNKGEVTMSVEFFGTDPTNKAHYIRLYGNEPWVNHDKGASLVSLTEAEWQAVLDGTLANGVPGSARKF